MSELLDKTISGAKKVGGFLVENVDIRPDSTEPIDITKEPETTEEKYLIEKATPTIKLEEGPGMPEPTERPPVEKEPELGFFDSRTPGAKDIFKKLVTDNVLPQQDIKQDKSIPPLKGFPYDTKGGEKNLLERISGIGKTPIFIGEDEYKLVTDQPDESPFKRKTPQEKAQERYNKIMQGRKSEYSVEDNLEEKGDNWFFKDIEGNVYSYAAPDKQTALKKAFHIDDKLRREGSSIFRDAEGVPKSFTTDLVAADGDVGLMITAAQDQLGKEYWTNHKLLKEYREKNPNGFLANALPLEWLAGLKTIGESPFTVGAPTLVLGLGQPLAEGGDTILGIFGADQPLLNFYSDVANMTLEDETVRMSHGQNMYTVNTNIGWTTGEPFTMGVDRNIGAITVDSLNSNTERKLRRPPDWYHTIIPRFVEDMALTLSVLFPFKKGAQIYTKNLRDDAIDSLGYKLSDDGSSYVLKQPPKGKFSDKPVSPTRTEIYTEMRKLHTERLADATGKLNVGATRFVKKLFREQQFLYGTNPVKYLKDVKYQVLGENVFLGIYRMLSGNKSILDQEKWYESGTAMTLEFLSAGIGNIIGGGIAKSNIIGATYDGIKYPFYKITATGANAGLPLRYISNKLAPGGFVPERDLSPQELIEYNKIGKEQKKEFSKLAKDIKQIRDVNPRLAQEIDKGYEFYTKLKRQLIAANKKAPAEFRFEEEELYATLGTIFQIRGLNIMRAQLAENIEKTGKSKIRVKEFIKAADVAAKKGKELSGVLRKQLDSLQVMSTDEANDAITLLKEHVQKAYDSNLESMKVSNEILGKAVKLKVMEMVDNIELGDDDAKLLASVLREHDLFKNDSSLERLKTMTNDINLLRKSISLNYLGGVKNQRKKLQSVSNPKNPKFEPYNVEIYGKDGRLKDTGQTMTFVSKNVDAAQFIARQSQKNGLNIVNNIYQHFKLHYSHMYDSVISSIPEGFETIDISNVLVGINKQIRAGGGLDTIPELKSKVNEISKDILSLRLKEAYKTAYESAKSEGVTEARSLGAYIKETKESLVYELTGEGDLGNITALDELDYLKEILPEDNFSINGNYKHLASLERTVRKALRKENLDIDKRNQLQGAAEALAKQKELYLKKLEKNGNLRQANDLRKLDTNYKTNVSNKLRQSKILAHLDKIQGEYTGPEFKGEAAKERAELLRSGYDEIDSVTGLDVAVPKVVTSFKINPKDEKLFDWIFENINPEDMEKELRVMFGQGSEVTTEAGIRETVYESVVNGSVGHPGYKAFLDNYEKWAAAKVAGMLDEAVAQGGTKINNTILSTKNTDIEAWKRIGKEVEIGDMPGQIGSKENKRFLRLLSQFEQATNGQMKIGRHRHIDQLNEWVNGDEKIAEAWNETMMLSQKIIDGRFARAAEFKQQQNTVIRALETRSGQFQNLSDAENFFQYAMTNKKAMMDAREAAIRGGMNPATWDKTVKRMLIKALIQRRTIGTAKGKIVYENTTDQQKAKEFSLKNGVKLKDIKKTKVKPKNSRDEQEMFIAPQKELDGMGMVEDLEEYGKTLEEYFGKDAATLEHFKLIVKLASFIDADEVATKSIKSGKFARGVTLSIPMLQSRLWAIASNRASYHYALSEGLLAFANGQNLDIAYALLNSDAELSGPLAKMLATGETKFSAEISPKYIEAFYADIVRGLSELEEGNREYLAAQDPYRRMLNVLFEMNPQKRPEFLFPAEPIEDQKLTFRSDAMVENNYILYNRNKYIQDIGRRFVEKLKQGPGINKDLTMQDIFEAAFAEYQAQSQPFTP